MNTPRAASRHPPEGGRHLRPGKAGSSVPLGGVVAFDAARATAPLKSDAPPSTWILLRGLTREAGHWGGFVADLQAALPGARMLTLDLPGNGALHRESSPTSVAAMVAACRAELLRQGVALPVHLLAMSLGAMVAAEWAHQAPDEVAACVLINTSLRPFSAVHRRLRPRNWASLLRLALRRRQAGAAERCVLALTSRQPERHTAVLPVWEAIREQRPVSVRNALRQLLAAARYRAPREKPAVPLLLLGSQHDGLVHSSCSQAIARAWACPLHEHPQAGHDLPLDDPRWVAQQVRLWLAGLGRADTWA